VSEAKKPRNKNEMDEVDEEVKVDEEDKKDEEEGDRGGDGVDIDDDCHNNKMTMTAMTQEDTPLKRLSHLEEPPGTACRI
jgi:hypothetical protein